MGLDGFAGSGMEIRAFAGPATPSPLGCKAHRTVGPAPLVLCQTGLRNGGVGSRPA